MFQNRRLVGGAGEKVNSLARRYRESVKTSSFVSTIDGLILTNVDNQLNVTTSQGSTVVLGNDAATPEDIANLQAQVDELEMFLTTPARALGTGTAIAGTGATSWSTAVTVSGQDGLCLTAGDGTILIGDDWVLCTLILEGTAMDSSNLGNIDRFSVDVDYPTNAMIEATVGGPDFDSNMITGGGSANSSDSNMTATCAVFGTTIPSRLRIRGQWYNRTPATTEGIQIRAFFIARATTTPMTRDFSGISRLVQPGTGVPANQVKEPENYDYVDVTSEGFRILWGHATSADFSYLTNYFDWPTVTSGAVSISQTQYCTILSSNVGTAYDIAPYFLQSALQVVTSLQSGFAEYRFVAFSPDANTLTSYTSPVTNIVGTAALTSGWYGRFQQYIIIFARLSFSTGAVRNEFILEPPGLYPVSTGAQIVGMGFVENSGAVYLEPNAAVWADSATEFHVRLNSAKTNGQQQFRVFIMYHTETP